LLVGKEEKWSTGVAVPIKTQGLPTKNPSLKLGKIKTAPGVSPFGQGTSTRTRTEKGGEGGGVFHVVKGALWA